MVVQLQLMITLTLMLLIPQASHGVRVNDTVIIATANAVYKSSSC
jgi:hypothetical protein